MLSSTRAEDVDPVGLSVHSLARTPAVRDLGSSQAASTLLD